MGSSGGHRRLPGGSDDFSLQTDRQTLHHNIYIIIIIIHQQPFLSRADEYCDRIDRNLSFAINPSKPAMRVTADGRLTIPRKN